MGLLKKLERKFFRTGIEISKEVEQRLMEHSWPGNIRELENVLERAINVLDGQTIEVFHLPLYLRELELQSSSQVDSHVTNTEPVEKLSSSIPSLKETLAQVEKEAIINALTVSNGNKQEAARLLEIGKTRFYEKCKLYDIK
jgi:DNA-binding NtrC family response regulator